MWVSMAGVMAVRLIAMPAFTRLTRRILGGKLLDLRISVVMVIRALILFLPRALPWLVVCTLTTKISSASLRTAQVLDLQIRAVSARLFSSSEGTSLTRVGGGWGGMENQMTAKGISLWFGSTGMWGAGKSEDVGKDVWHKQDGP